MSDDFTEIQGMDSIRRAQEQSLQGRALPQIPGYEVETRLGEGAYGEVWVARDRKNPGRRVAIKFYTRRGGDWTLLAREVEKLNFLATDRYVVQVLNVGWDADPPYYVMEFMERGSLAERLEKGTLPVSEALPLFRDVVVGVVNAHGRGVLHCDIKPANVLLGPDGKPRLADFGQSRLSHEDRPALGTLFYMAPEQADPKATPDARWDVYALGALLYCLLTGEPPYRDAPGVETLDEASGLEERLARYRRLLREAPRPRKHRHVPGVDRALAEVIDRCIAVNPARRFANAQAVLQALDARALRRARRPLLVMGALAPVLLLLVMGYLIRSELVAAVEKSTEALTEEARVSNEFAAEAVAEKVASKIDRRWRTLEQEASNPHFHRQLRAAEGKARGSLEWKALQDKIDELFKMHPEVSADSWSVFDHKGTLLALAGREKGAADKFIGKRFAHRDFFNGRDVDGKEGDPPLPPLARVHCSNVFLSNQTGTRKVAFSVPVWKGPEPAPDEGDKHPRLGVLMMTVEVGSFSELRPRGDDEAKTFVAVLVDQRGAILEHPLLARLRKRHRGVQDVAKKKEMEKELEFTIAQRDWLKPRGWNANYEDPVGERHAEYKGRWLAASQPVRIDERKDVSDIGWVVVVQERYDVAIGPVLQLESDMLARGRTALLVAVAVVTGLWLFVILLLNESAGSRLFAFLRRRAGLGGEALPSLKPSLSAPQPPRVLGSPGARTVRDQGEQ